jgi:AcrR family transcriptional regulator
MPRPRFQRLDATLRDAILTVAGREFARAGYEGASLNAIIVEVGLSKGVFYYYFDDKADLAATVLERVFERLLGPLERFAPPAGDFDFWEHIAAFTRETMADVRKNADEAELLSRLGADAAREPALAARLEPFLVRARAVSERFWRRGQEVGAVRRDLSPHLLAELAQRSKEVLARQLLPVGRAPTAAEEDRFIALHLDLVRRMAGGAP